MTNTIIAMEDLYREFGTEPEPIENLFHRLVQRDGTQMSANLYVHRIGAIEGHHPWTWACGADLAQWGAFARQEYTTEDIAWTLRQSENTILPQPARYTPIGDRSAALANRFDY